MLHLKKTKKKNEIIKKEDIIFKKQGFGINYDKVKSIIGKRLKKDTNSNRLLKWSDLN